MPYRRLPNTDQSRFRALRTAVEKGDMYSVYDLPFSQASYMESKSFLGMYEKEFFEYQQQLQAQTSKKQAHAELYKRARIYLSHFIQVLFLSIARREIKVEMVTLYGLDPDNLKVPDLNSQQALLDWGPKIMRGERERTDQGGSPIYSPSIATVSVHYNIFKDSFQALNLWEQTVAMQKNTMERLREQAQSIITAIWDEVEASVAPLSSTERYRKAMEYGLVYYLRKGESWEE